MVTIPDELADILDKPGIAHLASIGPDGEPHSHPVWYEFDTDRSQLLISTTTDRQKFHNIQRDARVSASITDPQDPYRYIELRGRITTVEPDGDKSFIDALASRYFGVDEYPNKDPDAERVILRLDVEHTASMGG